MEPLLRDTFVEINLDNLAYNMKNIKKMIGDEVAIAAVVKANAYGHGAIGIAQELMENGGDYLAVATLTEALELRRKFKEYNIFIMGYTPDKYLEYVVKNSITQTIFSLEQGKKLNEYGIKYGKKPKVHIKYDTGFNRIGFRDKLESLREIQQIYNLSNLNVEGIFSHLALAGDEKNRIQFNKFTKAIYNLEKMGIKFKYKHIADSIAAVDYSEYRLNMIRPGAIIYGIKGFHQGSLDLKPVMSFKSKVYNIKSIKKGETVSYDNLWKAEKDSIIGTIPFGYGDGYPRNLRDKGYITINGEKAPIIGIICMDQCMVDLSNITQVREGDEVIIYGDGNNNTMNIGEAAELADTNKNEIMSRISMRVPRLYIKNNKIIDIINYI